MKYALILLLVCIIGLVVNAQNVVPPDYQNIINSKQVQDKLSAMMPKSFTPEGDVSVMCGDMKASVGHAAQELHAGR
jgi:hypothetical protein